MKFGISINTLKQQTKLVVKHWPFTSIKNHQARELLSKLYGFENYHQYRKEIADKNIHLAPVNADLLAEQYPIWVKRLADLASINQIQAKNLIHKLWPAYLENRVNIEDKLYQCRIRFHGICNDFIEEHKRNRFISFKFDDRPSIKDTIEALGIPHTEVGAIQLNKVNSDKQQSKSWVDFKYLLMNEDEINVYPNPHESALLPYMPKGELVFLLDVHLGSLARYLRLAGFNCLHESRDYGDSVLAHMSSTHNYILLTRDIGLLKRSNVDYGYWIRNTNTLEQFKEVICHYQLANKVKAFSRCVKCNGLIHRVEKQQVNSKLPQDIIESYDEFRQCANCQQIYWQGSHFESIKQIIGTIKE